MIRYRYARHLQPPAPFVRVTVACPATGNRCENLPAQVDPGADRSVLPDAVVRALALVEDGKMLFQGFAGEVVELPIFLVEISMHDLPAVAIRAARGEHEPHILLGRDVLNAHRLVLDGPNLILDID
jgi:hypothetical protein